MNPLSRQLLMSAANKGVIPGGWNLGNVTDSTGDITAAGIISGRLCFGIGNYVYQRLETGEWSQLSIASLSGNVNKIASVVGTDNQTYLAVGGSANVVTRIIGGSASGTGFGTNGWISGTTRVLSMQLIRNGVWVVGGENGTYAQNLSYGSSGGWSTATLPGTSGLGTLGDVVEIVYKETAAYSGDSTGWWAFFRGGRYLHTTGTSYNGISNSNPSLFSGSTARTDLSSLFQTGETILSVELILNQFVVLTNLGRIFLSYTGFNWELRKDIRTGVNNHSFQDAVFDGQNYLVLASSLTGNNQIEVFNNKLENDTDFYDYNRFVIESATQKPIGNLITYHNGRYYIGLSNGQYLYRNVTVTPLTKPIIVPLEITTINSFISQPIFINYYNDIDQKYETQDVVIVNNYGNPLRESLNGVTVQVNNTSVFQGYPARVNTENYRRLALNSGNDSKLRIFGRRYRFRTVGAITSSPPSGFEEQGSVQFVNRWGNANFLGFDGSFASNKLLISLPADALTAENLQYCRYLDGMFMNCTMLNSFPKFSATAGNSIRGMSSMFCNCYAFNQPIANINGTFLSTPQLVDLTGFLKNAGQFNNQVFIDLSNLDFSSGNKGVLLNDMFNNCVSLTGTTLSNSITSLRFLNDPRVYYYANRMFSGCVSLCSSSLETAGNIWNVSQFREMGQMFNGCTNFNSNIDNWDTSLVTRTDFMFYACTIFNRNISSWNTSQITNMSLMFASCSEFNQNLTTNGLSWNTGNVFYMHQMFYGATKFNNGQLTNLKTAPLNWNTNKAISMNGMFHNAKAFNQDLNLFNTSGVTNMINMFRGATVFNGNISTWDTSKVTNMSFMFNGAEKFNLPLPWNTSNVTTMQEMFRGAKEFNQDIGTWNVAKVGTFLNMFYEATAFNNGGSNSITNWKTDSATNMSGMFYNAKVFNQPLNNNGLGSWNTSFVTNMSNMFFGCSTFDPDQPPRSGIGGWNVSQVTTMSGMFSGATKFNSNISNWDVSKVIDMSNMFNSCSVFNQPIGSWGQKTQSVVLMNGMFRGAIKFNQDLNAWNTSNVINMSEMFAYLIGTPGITHEFNGPINAWNTYNVKNMSGMFWRSKFNQPIGTWNTINVVNMNRMFRESNFNQPISTWDTRNVTDMSEMFSLNTTFNHLISTWNTSNVTNMSYMFYGATAFNNGGFLFNRYLRTNGTVTGWDTSKVTNMSFMFNGAVFHGKLYNWTLDEYELSIASPGVPRFQTLDMWCVANIPTSPDFFGIQNGLVEPPWGFCPTPLILQPVLIKSLNITSNQTNLDLRTWAVNNGWNRRDKLEVTINYNVYVYSTTIGTPALTVTGSFPYGVKLTNNGYIMGRGGDGGGGQVISGYLYYEYGGNGTQAIHIPDPTGNLVLVNNGGILGGGGGGANSPISRGGTGGGGAGGGNGGSRNTTISGSETIPGITGGTGGGPGEGGTVGYAVPYLSHQGRAVAYAAGGGGGRKVSGYEEALAGFYGYGGDGGGSGGGWIHYGGINYQLDGGTGRFSTAAATVSTHAGPFGTPVYPTQAEGPGGGGGGYGQKGGDVIVITGGTPSTYRGGKGGPAIVHNNNYTLTNNATIFGNIVTVAQFYA